MFVRLLSDLHLEFGKYIYQIPSTPQDHETILVLAGDIGLFKHANFAPYIQELAPRFRKIVMIAGNHEFYGSVLYTGVAKFKEQIKQCGNVHYLDNESIVIDDVLFIGSTMWTSLRNGNPMSMLIAEGAMNDFRTIRDGRGSYRRIKAYDLVRIFADSKEFIFKTLREEAPEYRKCIVITHHGPSYQSVPPEFTNNDLNDAYVSDLDYEIMGCGPDLWFHGHIHSTVDYMIEKTRVVTNPKGYNNDPANWENQSFCPTKVFDV